VEAKISELRNEMTKLQIEVNMIRQMLGSLARAEHSNVEALQRQVNPDTYGQVGNLMPGEQQAVNQLEQMKQIGNRLKQHVDQLSQILDNPERTRPNAAIMPDSYSPGLMDPVQGIY
jgi:hypothetical protein